jgi:hypothetical protein
MSSVQWLLHPLYQERLNVLVKHFGSTMKKALKKEFKARIFYYLKCRIGITTVLYRCQVWSVHHVTMM